MKTIDAVNELKANFDNSAELRGGDIRLALLCLNSNGDWVEGSIYEGQTGYESYYFEEICSESEFNTLVQECMTNFGTDITYAEYKLIHNNYLSCLKARKADKAKKESNMKPVFTQEMSDNGELPSVGMECLIMYSSSNYKGTITYMGDGVGVYRSKDNNKEYTFALVSVKFRALDTRTDKEKAIDDLRNADDSVCNDIEWHKNFLQLVIDGKIHGVKWVGK